MKKRKAYTPEDRLRIVAAIKELKRSGKTIGFACQRQAITPTMYYGWLKTLPKTKRVLRTYTKRLGHAEPQHLTLTIPSPDRFERIQTLLNGLLEATK